MIRVIKVSEIERKRNSGTGIRVRNTKVRKGRFQFTPRQIVLVALMLFVFMGSGIGYVWSNFEGTQIGYDVSRLKHEELRLKDLNKKLRLELATLKSPQYLEEAARAFGLKAPSPAQIVVLP
jgi:cell division protein FtsL